MNQPPTYLTILGRQPEISLAELTALYTPHNVRLIAPHLALVTTPTLSLPRLGGTLKAGRLLTTPPLTYLKSLPKSKLTIGISDYRPSATTQSVVKTATHLKQSLKKSGYSVRTITGTTPILTTATSHHNKLGLSPNKIEFLYFPGGIALSTGAQNITAYAHRDHARPARDARIGMLPPKLAQIMINLATGQLKNSPNPPQIINHEHYGPSAVLRGASRRHDQSNSDEPRNDGREERPHELLHSPHNVHSIILDPFCGTGTILQEAALMGYHPYGTDISPKMIAYTQKNLSYLHLPTPITLEQADATTHKWHPPIDAVVTETYLGPPLSTPPTAPKLSALKSSLTTLILHFLKNLSTQIRPTTPLTLAIPAWKTPNGTISHLEILDEITNLGYNVTNTLLYHRENQIVGREIIVLRKK